MKRYDVIVIGAGASGLFAARGAIRNAKTVAILDMGPRPARKVAVSGGGRCNFTNLAASRDRYFGANPDFVRSALAAVPPSDMRTWMDGHHLAYAEKAPGQYFCATGADDVVNALISDVRGADLILNAPVADIEKVGGDFIVYAGDGAWAASSVIVATGGLSYPTLGVSDFGYKIARKFGHKITRIEPGLVGLKTRAFGAELAGLSVPVKITSAAPLSGKNAGRPSRNGPGADSLLFTHSGLGGPAAYRASLFGLMNDMTIDFAPGIDGYDWLKSAKVRHGKKTLASVLALLVPAKLAKALAGGDSRNIANFRDSDLIAVARKINRFLIPAGAYARHGFASAEVTTGGIATDGVSSKTMESKRVPGLYFVGEVLDITGDLGGFNLHFAFASGHVAGMNAGRRVT